MHPPQSAANKTLTFLEVRKNAFITLVIIFAVMEAFYLSAEYKAIHGFGFNIGCANGHLGKVFVLNRR